MGGTNKIAERRRRIWNRDPRCYWCGIKTVLPEPGAAGKLPENTATLDHLRSRYDTSRRELNPQWEERTVLACWKCNNERCRAETEAMPNTELRRRAAGPQRSKTVILRSLRHAMEMMRHTAFPPGIGEGLIKEVAAIIAQVEEMEPDADGLLRRHINGRHPVFGEAELASMVWSFTAKSDEFL